MFWSRSLSYSTSPHTSLPTDRLDTVARRYASSERCPGREPALNVLNRRVCLLDSATSSHTYCEWSATQSGLTLSKQPLIGLAWRSNAVLKLPKSLTQVAFDWAVGSRPEQVRQQLT